MRQSEDSPITLEDHVEPAFAPVREASYLRVRERHMRISSSRRVLAHRMDHTIISPRLRKPLSLSGDNSCVSSQ